MDKIVKTVICLILCLFINSCKTDYKYIECRENDADIQLEIVLKSVEYNIDSKNAFHFKRVKKEDPIEEVSITHLVVTEHKKINDDFVIPANYYIINVLKFDKDKTRVMIDGNDGKWKKEFLIPFNKESKGKHEDLTWSTQWKELN